MIITKTLNNKNQYDVDYKKFYFPSGEMGIEFTEDALHTLYDVAVIEIVAQITTPDEIIELMLINDALRNMLKNNNCDDVQFRLSLPYIPFGRQDRHTTSTSPFSLKVFADMLNSCKFDDVVTFDPHSNVSELLINNLHISSSFPRHYFKEKSEDTIIIAPDAGAEKRAYKYAECYKFTDVVVCSKKRNAVTGEIMGYQTPVIEDDKHLIVIDDICDGGRTFIELAKKLPEKRKSLTLIVSHGIFSKGRQVLLDAGYDNVFASSRFIEERLIQNENDTKIS